MKTILVAVMVLMMVGGAWGEEWRHSWTPTTGWVRDCTQDGGVTYGKCKYPPPAPPQELTNKIGVEIWYGRFESLRAKNTELELRLRTLEKKAKELQRNQLAPGKEEKGVDILREI